MDCYCPKPRLALNRAIVLRIGFSWKARSAASTINVRLAARRLAYEAADTGLLSPELVAGIRRVKWSTQLGRRVGNWLSPQKANSFPVGTTAETLRKKGDGLSPRPDFWRSSEREDHWATVDLVGKSRHLRTVPLFANDSSASSVFGPISR
jgi:hypothetical protein